MLLLDKIVKSDTVSDYLAPRLLTQLVDLAATFAFEGEAEDDVKDWLTNTRLESLGKAINLIKYDT